MKKSSILACALVMACQTPVIMAQDTQNPFLTEYTNKYKIPPFDKIKTSDFIPAIEAGIKEQDRNLDAIVKNRAMPDFDNVILLLEHLSPILERVQGVFYHYMEALNTPEFAEMSDKAIPMLNDANNRVMLNDLLFQKIKQVYDTRNSRNLTPVQKRLVEKYYRQFAEQGAALNEEQKKELVKINDELSKLYIQYNRNLLNATNQFAVVVYDKADLAGLPESSVAVASEEAEKRGLKGLWVFTLHAPSRLPVLQYADNRGLRQAIYEGYTSLASYGENSNMPVISKIIKLRNEKAKLMGFKDFASMMTSRVMAQTPQAATDLLMKVFEPAVKRSAEEVADMQAYVDKEGGNFKIAPWDYYYYADKVKQQKYNFDEAAARPYFSLDNVMKGLFDVTEQLYGVKIKPIADAPKYTDELQVYDITDAKTGEHIAVWMCDYFPRESKRQGAWMEQMQAAGYYGEGDVRRPIVYNVGNFTKPTATTPSLLTIDEVETTFHEFGHALQGMLTRAGYKSLAGTNVDRDYVEMPSQMNEHWAFAPEVLKNYARHYKTGEPMTDEMIEKLVASRKFNQGFMTTELAGAALLDMKYGEQAEVADPAAFEAAVAKEIGMPDEITFRYRSPYFKHIFGDEGYASGYYTYIWAQVLEADGWELFEEKGVLDPKTAASYKKNILESGDTEDAMVLFTRFRGHKPDAEALLRLRGFAPAKNSGKKAPMIKPKKK